MPDAVVEHNSRLLLSTTNYYSWLITIEAKLDDIGAYQIVSGISSAPELPNPETEEDLLTIEKELKTYNDLNRKGYNLIIQHLDIDNLDLVSTVLPIEHKFNGKALWKLLRKEYDTPNYPEQVKVFAEFHAITFKDPSSFILQIDNSRNRLRQVGFKFDERSYMSMVISKLFLSKLPAASGLAIDLIDTLAKQASSSQNNWLSRQ
ncbi:hypothetical protein MJO28_006260 [Puccinia striiformis f. sp. tritici]|uniref:DUF4219 domain-containing protein n=5 Tax=Puccinia striiformis TaxID=27350 RepID=A0A0L0VKY7_9BASI|nr:hypothetical protein Pst134EA_033412 [Puccinia striiformis f. sp. tritici]KNE99937.1 hypothetical protein PSTG_06791 [Puccinia striiformis f. sp. tritici PST-78]POV95612.1 hypothetical protein PSHT_15582 [Puccinia striiformis]KAH9456232.1 hypothetical protein Pst134EB_033429 [Puccinia striiformis f. sp. tritici]KAH9467837.1 hypothetical protein Pst134EA_033412 [Puccinia striiformis f. sp. tritici]KAI7953711.1 hypothetical protein MJO28_006258 [Puccinia striiformis f. sp. tritici]